MKSNLVKYVAEILVITLSILAAFWLENWNQDNQEKKKRREALVLIQDEIIRNYTVLDHNLSALRAFNEEVKVIDFLNGSMQIDSAHPTFECDLSQLDSIKNIYSENERIQNIKAHKTINNHKSLFSNEINIDFFLDEFNFGMWEATRNSGALIGTDPIILSKLSIIYNSFRKDFGYTERDYHKAMISPGYQKYTSLLKIIDATTVLEQSLRLKKMLIDKQYKEVLNHITKYRKD